MAKNKNKSSMECWKLSSDGWHHTAITIGTQKVRTFLDGVEINTESERLAKREEIELMESMPKSIVESDHKRI